MPEETWTLAKLTPEQERQIKEAERTLGDHQALLAFSKAKPAPGQWMPAHFTPSELTSSQLECVQGLERNLGLVVLAVQPT